MARNTTGHLRPTCGEHCGVLGLAPLHPLAGSALGRAHGRRATEPMCMPHRTSATRAAIGSDFYADGANRPVGAATKADAGSTYRAHAPDKLALLPDLYARHQLCEQALSGDRTLTRNGAPAECDMCSASKWLLAPRRRQRWRQWVAIMTSRTQ